MARPLRIQFPGACYHVMNRGAARRRIFFDDSDYERFVGLLREVATRWKVEFYAYCCMSNH